MSQALSQAMSVNKERKDRVMSFQKNAKQPFNPYRKAALKDSTKNATSRSSVKKQAKLLSEGALSGRNSATYAYLLQTVSNCIPPSLSRGNIAFGLYHKACVQEGVMDANVIKAMRSIGGYKEDGNDDVTAPPVTNGPIFDKFLQEELGDGVSSALEKGRGLRQDRNYKLRRHVDWDDTY